MTDNNELVELAKKCGARAYSSLNRGAIPEQVTFTPEQLREFAEAIQAQLVSEGWRQCAKGQGETQHCAASSIILNEVADWMDAKGIAHVSANALRHYMAANIGAHQPPNQKERERNEQSNYP